VKLGRFVIQYTSCFGYNRKILESIIRDHIVQFFVSNSLFSNKDYGFIKGRSTVQQRLKILDEWTEKIDNGGRIDVIYTDLEKHLIEYHIEDYYVN